ncbi:hypothetical protein NBRC10512_003458 [Rhodotorula toruloides]|uniref:RHTO0S02e06194g2_1 n=1 Tax=Rhodotorula toruloides TaxID=5286 RepID=A0A061AGM4_RHOTO|nr:RHTO0S02e06194g2_1 [Rhodotorula toruloides]
MADCGRKETGTKTQQRKTVHGEAGGSACKDKTRDSLQQPAERSDSDSQTKKKWLPEADSSFDSGVELLPAQVHEFEPARSRSSSTSKPRKMASTRARGSTGGLSGFVVSDEEAVVYADVSAASREDLRTYEPSIRRDEYRPSLTSNVGGKRGGGRLTRSEAALEASTDEEAELASKSRAGALEKIKQRRKNAQEQWEGWEGSW